MIEYELQRRKKKNISLTIKNGGVFVSAPLRITKSQIDAFVKSKESWINNKLAQYAKRNELLSDIISYKKVAYRGNSFCIMPDTAVKKFTFKENCLLYNAKYANGQPNSENEALKNALERWFKRLAKDELKMRLDYLCEKLKYKYTAFSLTNAKNKWGSCDGENRIKLNWRLLFLSAELVDYVIVHELCHTLHHNHSKSFWLSVESIMPDYKYFRKKLKEYSVLTELFR